MILFVFEGKEREVDIFKALKELYLSDDEVIVEFTYNTGFHTLYRNLKKNDMSLFRVLQEASKKRKDDKLGAYDEDDFSADKDYYKYTIKRDECVKVKGDPKSGFKCKAADFSAYKGLDFIQITDAKTADERDDVRKNWNYLKRQNVAKAHYLCAGRNTYPRKKVIFPQAAIFEKQCKKYVNTKACCVSILNAFPIFLYDYFK